MRPNHRVEVGWRRFALAVGLAGILWPATAVRGQHTPVVLDAFVVAHADDWQLFIGDVVVETLRSQRPVLVIVASAGDAARGTEFWQTREAAALASMRAALALAGEPPGQTACASRRVRIPESVTRAPRTTPGTRSVRLCISGRAATVFLRLPDGRPDGLGYAMHGYQSMFRLATNGYGPLEALDHSTTYTSRDDVIETIAAIIRDHQPFGLAVRVHTHDPDRFSNPIDHSDHREIASSAIAAAHALHAPVMLYAGYSNVQRADNLSPESAAWKAYCFVQYDRAMMAVHGTWSAYAENAWAHALYLSRTYVRADPQRELWRPGWPWR